MAEPRIYRVVWAPGGLPPTDCVAHSATGALMMVLAEQADDAQGCEQALLVECEATVRLKDDDGPGARFTVSLSAGISDAQLKVVKRG